jgi:DNA-binding NtrC family response regulator
VRELKNLVQRLLILGAGEEITQDEVEAAMGGGRAVEHLAPVMPISFDQPLRQAREQFEKIYLEYQLQKHGGNVSKTAQDVGMERTHLYRKLRTLGVEIKDRK